MKPFVSVIVAVRNEEKYIKKCIDSLINQSYENFEIIVVDGMSEDKTQNIVKKYQKKHKNIFLIENEKKIQSVGRNLAIKIARGEIIAYLDGHSYADRNWLENLVKVLVSTENVGGCGSVHVTPEDESFLSRCIGEVFNTRLGGFKSSYSKIYKIEEVETVPFVAYKKNVLKDIGFYDENFERGEDAELNYRLVKKGYRLLRNPKAVVYYYKKDSFMAFFKQMFFYGVARMMMARKHPKSLKIHHWITSFEILAGLFFSILGFFNPLFWLLLFFGIFFYILWILIETFFIFKKMRDTRVFFYAPILYILEHVSYGIGFMYGFLKRKPFNTE